MKVNDENVVKEMECILYDIKQAHECSKSNSCDLFLYKAMGRVEALITILSVTEDEEN